MKDRFDGVVQHMLDTGIFLDQAIEILEQGMIQGALERNRNNQCAAARLLGIHRNTLQRKMVEYHIAMPRTRARRKPAAQAGPTRKRKAAIA